MQDIEDPFGQETGRRLGYDLFRYGVRFPSDKLPGSVGEGYLHASRTATRTTPDRFVRKWLQLRLSAYRRSRAFDERVTPKLLAAIDVAECPVIRSPLTHAELKDSDWSIDRLNNDGAYAVNNLVVMSTRANKAKGSKSFEEVCALAGMAGPTNGLTPAEWQRLAALMLGPCFALAPAEAPVLPEVVPITAHRLMLGTQQFQHLLCNAAKSQSGKNALIKAFRAATPDERSRVRLDQLLEAVHASLKTTCPACDIWLQQRVMSGLLEWRSSLRLTAWASVMDITRQLCGAQTVPERRLTRWHLGDGGYVDAKRFHPGSRPSI